MSTEDAAAKFADLVRQKQSVTTAETSDETKFKASFARYSTETLIPAIEQLRKMVTDGGLLAIVENGKSDVKNVERLLIVKNARGDEVFCYGLRVEVRTQCVLLYYVERQVVVDHGVRKLEWTPNFFPGSAGESGIEVITEKVLITDFLKKYEATGKV